MNAIHSTWSKPRLYSSGGFYIEDFDILTTILSALKWQELNGQIKMVTDSTGFEFYNSRGMTGIWDEITTDLDNMPQTIDPEIFWAAGKLFALSRSDLPMAIIDTDFIVWERIAFNTLGDLTVIHREELSPGIYPDPDKFLFKNGYELDDGYNYSERPANTAFYVIKSDKLKVKYTDAAFEFMENSAGHDPLTYMVFAEQRLLAMTANRLGIPIGEFSYMERLFRDGARAFTHTWGMKEQMRRDPKLRQDFCLRCIKRIVSDFPEHKKVLKEIKELQPFFT
ncbi:MAG: hypothetical protein IJH37_04805 [Clostridia bacterium]|nr:hypothetical protein [Clostridia bacterium]